MGSKLSLRLRAPGHWDADHELSQKPVGTLHLSSHLPRSLAQDLQRMTPKTPPFLPCPHIRGGQRRSRQPTRRSKLRKLLYSRSSWCRAFPHELLQLGMPVDDHGERWEGGDVHVWIMTSQCRLSNDAFVTSGQGELESILAKKRGRTSSGRAALLHERISWLHFLLPLRNASSMAMISFSVGTKQYVPRYTHKESHCQYHPRKISLR